MKTKFTLFDKIMLAITFAEANAAEEVMEVGTKCKTRGPCLTLFGKPQEGNTLTSIGFRNRAEV